MKTNYHKIRQYINHIILLITIVSFTFCGKHSEDDTLKNFDNLVLKDDIISLDNENINLDILSNQLLKYTLKYNSKTEEKVNIILYFEDIDNDLTIKNNAITIEKKKDFLLKDNELSFNYQGKKKELILPFELKVKYKNSLVTKMKGGNGKFIFTIIQPSITSFVEYKNAELEDNQYVIYKDESNENHININKDIQISLRFSLVDNTNISIQELNKITKKLVLDNLQAVDDDIDISYHDKTLVINDNSIEFPKYKEEKNITNIELLISIKKDYLEATPIELKYKLQTSNDFVPSFSGTIRFNILSSVKTYRLITKINDIPYTYRNNENQEFENHIPVTLNIELTNIEEEEKGINQLSFNRDADFFKYFDILNNPTNSNIFDFTNNKLQLELLPKKITESNDNLIKYDIINTEDIFFPANEKIKYQVVDNIKDFNIDTFVNNEKYTYREDNISTLNVNEGVSLDLTINNLKEIEIIKEKGENQLFIAKDAEIFNYLTLTSDYSSSDTNNYIFTFLKDKLNIAFTTIKSTEDKTLKFNYQVINTENLFNSLNQSVNFKVLKKQIFTVITLDKKIYTYRSNEVKSFFDHIPILFTIELKNIEKKDKGVNQLLFNADADFFKYFEIKNNPTNTNVFNFVENKVQLILQPKIPTEQENNLIEYQITNTENLFNPLLKRVNYEIKENTKDFNISTTVNQTPYTHREDNINRLKINEEINIDLTINNLEEIETINNKGDNIVLLAKNAEIFKYLQLISHGGNDAKNYVFFFTDNTLNIKFKSIVSSKDNTIKLDYIVKNTNELFYDLNQSINFKINQLEYDISRVILTDEDDKPRSTFTTGEKFNINFEIVNVLNQYSDTYIQLVNDYKEFQTLFKKNDIAIDLTKKIKLNELVLNFTLLKPITNYNLQFKVFDESKTDKKQHINYQEKIINLPIVVNSNGIELVGKLNQERYLKNQQGYLDFNIIKKEGNIDNLADYRFKLVLNRQSDNIKDLHLRFKSSRENTNTKFKLDTEYNISNEIATSLNNYKILFDIGNDFYEDIFYDISLIVINKQNDEFILNQIINIDYYSVSINSDKYNFNAYNNIEQTISINVNDINFDENKLGYKLSATFVNNENIEYSIAGKTITFKLVDKPRRTISFKLETYHKDYPNQIFSSEGSSITFNITPVIPFIRLESEYSQEEYYSKQKYAKNYPHRQIGAFLNKTNIEALDYTPNFIYEINFYTETDEEINKSNFTYNKVIEEGNLTLKEVRMNVTPEKYKLKIRLIETVTAYDAEVTITFTIADLKDYIEIAHNEFPDKLYQNVKYEFRFIDISHRNLNDLNFIGASSLDFTYVLYSEKGTTFRKVLKEETDTSYIYDITFLNIRQDTTDRLVIKATETKTNTVIYKYINLNLVKESFNINNGYIFKNLHPKDFDDKYIRVVVLKKESSYVSIDENGKDASSKDKFIITPYIDNCQVSQGCR